MMKTLTQILTVSIAIFMVTDFLIAQQQIQFEGSISQGEGIAIWDADGSGPEPSATGHPIPTSGFGNQAYYCASHDYITGNPNQAAFHFLPNIAGFPEFEQALADNGYTLSQVKVKNGLASLRDDIEGEDWFIINEWAYANYYDVVLTIELNGEQLLVGLFNYADFSINVTTTTWQIETSYTPLHNVAIGNSMVAIAEAFLNDIDNKEIKISYESTFGQNFEGNGRDGTYYNIINGLLETGFPTLPIMGMAIDHEGLAAWDADGTGPEPYGNGHLSKRYYIASRDYDDIDSVSSACLFHFLDNSTGFRNLKTQLIYRGLEAGNLKLKYDLASLGPDVNGEDWDTVNGVHWANFYNNKIIIELNNEPIIMFMTDTTLSIYPPGGNWSAYSSPCKAYDVSENASPEAQFVAQSLLRDLGSHYIFLNSNDVFYAGNISGNGRVGFLFEIPDASLIAISSPATFVPAGIIEGTWGLENSPYYVDGDIIVENGHTLTIEPGVKVAVRGPYHFDVQGCVKAEGSVEETIVFTRSNPNFYWDGFDYNETPATNETSVFNHCLFEYGMAQGAGKFKNGGMFSVYNYSNLKIYNSTFRHNKANILGTSPPSGGALALEVCNLSVEKCIFYDNNAEEGGALITSTGSHPIISNCLFFENRADKGGAIAFSDNGNAILLNSTIVDNSAIQGGGLYFCEASYPEIINTVLWGNEATISGNQAYSSEYTCNPGFYYCDIEEGQSGFGIYFQGNYLFNLEEDPVFETNVEFPYILSAASPCINMGTPDTSAWYYGEYLPDYCLCGNPRTLNGRIDIGAYENLITSLNDKILSNSIAFQIYPNPSTKYVSIEFENGKSGPVSICIYDITGKFITNFDKKTLTSGKHKKVFNLAGLNEGVYFCRLKIENKTVTKKIIKVK